MVVKDCGHFPAATIVLLSKELNLEFLLGRLTQEK